VGTGRGAGSAAGTALPIRGRAPAYGPGRADLGAAEAADAEPAVPQDFRGGMLGFGVGTPAAAQGTALEEDNRAYPRPVMDAEFLNVEDKTCFVQTRLFFNIPKEIPFVKLNGAIREWRYFRKIIILIMAFFVFKTFLLTIVNNRDKF
jgi:hypothetical protein